MDSTTGRTGSRFLNRLPTIDKCFCVKKPKNTVELLMKLGFLFFTPILLLALIRPNLLGLNEAPLEYFFIFIMFLWVVSCVILMIAWLLVFKKQLTVDLIFQIQFWLVVVTVLLHLAFCVTFLLRSDNENQWIALTHLGTWLVIFILTPFALLVINSYRMTLFRAVTS